MPNIILGFNDMLRASQFSFPLKESDRVKYSMRIVGAILADLKKNYITPSPHNPIKLYQICSNVEEMRYLWTAAMLFGKSIPEMKFNIDAIRCSKLTSYRYLKENEILRCYRFAGKNYVYDPVDQSSQIGWMGDFSASSLYEVKFKHHLTNDMLVLDTYKRESYIDILNDKKASNSNERKAVSLEFEDINFEIILAGEFIDEFNSKNKFNNGFYLPHDGYLQLALIAIEDYIRKDSLTAVDNRVVYMIGNISRPLRDAMTLYCIHNNIRIIDNSHSDAVSAFTVKQIARYIERVSSDGAGMRLFDEAKIKEFLSKLRSLSKIKMIIEDKRKSEVELERKVIAEKKLELEKEERDEIDRIQKEKNEVLRKESEAIRLQQELIDKIRSEEQQRKHQAEKLRKDEEDRINKETHSLFMVCENEEGFSSIRKSSAFIDNGADINRLGWSREAGVTPLMVALEHQNEQLAYYLISRGADPFIKDLHGKTVAEYVTPYSLLYDVIMKMKKERELNSLPLQVRVDRELHEEVISVAPLARNIKEILSRGANVNYQDKDGYTALMLSTDRQNERIVSYLLSQGANPLLKNKSQETAKMLTLKGTCLFQLLQEAEDGLRANALSSRDYQSIRLFSYVSGSEVSLLKIDEYIETGADINYQDEKGFTCLIISVARGSDIVADYLLKCGANPLIKNNKGKMASDYSPQNSAIYSVVRGFELLLHVANADLNSVKYLLNQDPGLVNFKGHDGYTSLMIAAENGYMNVFEFLISFGADISIRNRDGHDIFDLTDNEEMLNIIQASSGLGYGQDLPLITKSVSEIRSESDVDQVSGVGVVGLFAEAKGLKVTSEPDVSYHGQDLV